MDPYFTDEHIPGPYEQVSTGWWIIRCSCGQSSPRERNPIGAAREWMERHRQNVEHDRGIYRRIHGPDSL
jgi:hypothetical protein